jgi:hypothetical protein
LQCKMRPYVDSLDAGTPIISAIMDIFTSKKSAGMVYTMK